MGTLVYLAAIVCMALVVIWYVLDHATRGGAGRSGLLSMDDHAGSSPKPEKSSAWKPQSEHRPWRVRRH